jgi:hypothetical protein
MANEQLTIAIATLIADELGDDFDKAHYDKAEWINDRGGDPFRDVNLPFQRDYLAAAAAVLRMPEISEAVRIWRNHGEPTPYEGTGAK